MPRPTEYRTRRIDTKVRIRSDQADALAQKMDETGLSRNRLIEQAIDFWLEPQRIKPRLAKTPSDPKIQTGGKPSGRVSKRIDHIGEAAARQAEAAQANRARQVQPRPKTKHSPRRNG